MTKPIAGPRADSHPPRAFLPPPGACDAHCHIFGPSARLPFAPDPAYTPPDAGLEMFEALRRRLGLSRAVFVQASCHGTDNAAMVDALERGEGRYAGVAMTTSVGSTTSACGGRASTSSPTSAVRQTWTSSGRPSIA